VILATAENEATVNKSMLAELSDAERLLVTETDPNELAALDEDQVDALHHRIRRARNKYVGLYRREASARVRTKGGRGKARPANRRNAIKAEVFEDALSRVSRRLGVLAKQAAADLRAERIESARASKAASSSGRVKPKSSKKPRAKHSQTSKPRGDRSLRSPRTEKNRGGTLASGARRQAKRDNR